MAATTFGEGNGGTLTVEVEEFVELIGIGAQTSGIGNGGDVRLTAGQLFAQDGATVSAGRGRGV